jgi:hypothetical protein
VRKTSVALAFASIQLVGGVASAAIVNVDTVRSYWNADHTAILSDVEVENDDGTRQSRQVLGGSVDGIAMVQIAQYSAAGPAFEYVPTVNTAKVKLHWGGSCVFITPDSAGSTAIPQNAEISAIQAALTEWNTKTASCGYLRFILEPAEALEVGNDGKNTVKFRENKWCRPDSCSDPSKWYDPGATAITTLFYVDKAERPDNGTILDADVEINGVDYAMAVGCETHCVTQATNGVVQDLQNTLTHEFGHVIGLAHTCWPGAPALAPLDGYGNPAPCCGSRCPDAVLPPVVTNATMYNFQAPMEISKRTLSQDDVNGACATYPRAKDPMVCEPTAVGSPAGCSTAVGGRSRGGLAVLIALALVGLIRGRARNRTR